MERTRRRRLIFMLCLSCAALFAGAWVSAAPLEVPALVTPVAAGGEFTFAAADELSAAAESRIVAEIAANQERLRRAGRLPAPSAAATVALAWPLQPAAGFADYSYYITTYYVDHDPAYPDQLRDYMDGDRTYDTVGYNHGGTDFILWPFGWLKMDSAAVAIVAAADGVIVGKSDGNDDRHCAFSNEPWNAVYVQHADGTVAWYGHMKQGSLTAKNVGDPVVTGEYLGLVGSSGSSTVPHLHFELRSSAGADSQVVDPFFGPGNPTLPQSLWQNQRSYDDSAIIHLGTGHAAPEFPQCPQQENPNEDDLFDPGAEVYFSAYYRDQMQDQVSELRILRPDGTEHADWTHASQAPHLAAAYWYWYITLPGNAQHGEWRFQVTYAGVTYSRSFFVGAVPPTATVTPTPTITATAQPSTTATTTATRTPISTVPPVRTPGATDVLYLPLVNQ